MKPSKARGRIVDWRLIVGTSTAGLLTFAAAGFLTLVLREASVSAPTPPTRTATARDQAPAFPQAANAALLHAAATAVTSDIPAVPMPPERLRGTVAHNPFAALNGFTAPPITAASGPPAKAPAPAKPEVKPVATPSLPPAPPAPPTAPPLPFVAVGSIQGTQVTNGQPVAFIRQQEQLMVVRAGDAIGQNYKVESISPQTIEFTYLPLMQRQTLALAP